MPDKIPQTYANHQRADPWFLGGVALPVLANVLVMLWQAIQQGGWLAWWGVVMALALLVMTGLLRTYPLKVQDRVIRLEERLRLGALAPELKPRFPEISEKQWVALRFASDAELPALARRALDEKLEPRAIKQAIREWRPDTFRV